MYWVTLKQGQNKYTGQNNNNKNNKNSNNNNSFASFLFTSIAEK